MTLIITHDQVVRGVAALLALVPGMELTISYPGADCTATPCAVVYPGKATEINGFDQSYEIAKYHVPVRILFERQPAKADAVQRATLFIEAVRETARGNVRAVADNTHQYLGSYEITQAEYQAKLYVCINCTFTVEAHSFVTFAAPPPLVS